jgi:hemerythrin-like metal-binding protein
MLIATAKNEPSVGIQILDVDHREIDESLKELHSKIANGWRRSQVGDLLRGLSRFTLNHFALEEGMMVATHYPLLQAHSAHHARLMREMNLFLSRYFDEGVSPDIRWLNFVAASARGHAQADDLYFGDWLKRN